MKSARSASLYVRVTVWPELFTTADTKVGAVMSRVELLTTLTLLKLIASLPVTSWIAAFVGAVFTAGAVYLVSTTTFPASIVAGPVKITSVPLTLIPVGSQADPATVTPKFAVVAAGSVEPISSLYRRISLSPVVGTLIDWSTGAVTSAVELFVTT